MARPPIDIASAVHGAARTRASAPAPDRTARKPRSRQGTKGIVTYVSPELSRALRQIALDEDTSLQALGIEAFQALLERRGRDPDA